jgi:hypothetical protein
MSEAPRTGWLPEPAPKPRFNLPGWTAPVVFAGGAAYTWFDPSQVMGWFGVTSGDGPAGLERLGHYLAAGLALIALWCAVLAATSRSRAEHHSREADPAGT